MSKKKNAVTEPQYYQSATNIQTLNYKVYYMKPLEKRLYFLGAFVVGALVGFLFYGGIGKDSYGNATVLTYILDAVFSIGFGTIAGKLFIPMRTEQIISGRKKKLKSQFRDMLDGITTSLGAGNNIMFAFTAVYNDLQVQYPADAFIVKELEVILSGMQSNFRIEDMLEDFGKRSGVDDIESFANVFRVCNRKGGNIQDVIRNTHEILSQKMKMNEEIETTISGSKMDQNIMIILPIALIAIIKLMSPEFGSYFASAAGIVATTVAIGLFITAYLVGKSIMNIKV